MMMVMMIIITLSRYRYKNRPREPPASRKRRLSEATDLNLPLPTIVLVAKIKYLIYPIHQPGRKYKMHHTHDNGKRSQPCLGNCFRYAAYQPRWMFGKWTVSGKWATVSHGDCWNIFLIPRIREWNMCYVEAKRSSSDPDSNIIYGSNSKSLLQSLKRLNLHPNTYIQMQKSVILGTCSIVRNFLNYK